ncbi:MAG TPA: WD40 repeat domain-containing protein, partial [Gemmataceae bacterium]|nr:WD40 repeat domain-containing protein [Gemmataceae bacterium]
LRAWHAETQTREKLFDSRLAEARALTFSGRPGQRFASLARVEEAADLARSLKLAPARWLELRNAAVAALARPDLCPEQTWPGFPAGSFAVDFDGRLETYARTDRDGNCHICRVGTAEEMHLLPAPPGAAPAARPVWPWMSPDGRFVAVGRQRFGELQLWQLDGTHPEVVLTATKVWWVDFRSDSQQVAISRVDGSITVHDLVSHRRIARLAPEHPTQEIMVALHPHEPLVAVASYFSPTVQIRDVRTNRVLASLPMPHGANQAAWHPDGHLLAVLDSRGGGLHFYDRQTFQLQASCPGATGYRLAFSPAGDLVATHDYGRAVQLFDAVGGRKVLEFTTAIPTALLRFSADGRRLAGFTQGEQLGIWQVSAGGTYRTLTSDTAAAPPDRPQMAAIDATGRVVAGTRADGVAFWDLASGRRTSFLPLDHPDGVAFTGGDHPALLTMTWHSGVYRWPIRTASGNPEVWQLGPPEPFPLPPGWMFQQTQDGRTYVTSARRAGATDGWAGAWVWRPGEHNSLRNVEPDADMGAVALSPDGRWLVTTPWDLGPAKLWDARTGQFSRQLAPSGDYPQFSPDGQWLSICGPDGGLYATDSWQKKRSARHYHVFAPDGVTAAEYTEQPHVVRLIEVASGQELVRLEEPHAHRIRLVLFSPDGSRLVSATTAGTVHCWDLRLLRSQLAERGLDWDAPPLPPANPARAAPQLRIERGDYDRLRQSHMLTINDRAINAAPQLAVRWYRRGLRLWSLGRQKEAIDDLEQALKRQPDQAVLCNALAWCYASGPVSCRNAREAVRLAERATRLAPARWESWNTLGLAYYRAERLRDAIAAVEKSLRGSATEADGFNLYVLAMCHGKRREAAEARTCLARGLAWQKKQTNLDPQHLTELQALRAEAEKVLGTQAQTMSRDGISHGPAPPAK